MFPYESPVTEQCKKHAITLALGEEWYFFFSVSVSLSSHIASRNHTHLVEESKKRWVESQENDVCNNR